MVDAYDTTPQIRYRRDHQCLSFGTLLSAAGTILTGVTDKILKIHQYSISANGTIVYSLNNAKPTGGTLDFGGFLNSGIVSSPNTSIVKPFVPYPDFLFATTSKGSALCLGTYDIAPVLGTVYIQGLYTATDSS